MASPESFDGSFNFCRIMFSQSNDGDGGGWFVDYPRADINLSIRLSELTRTHISRDAAGEPNHVLLRLTDDLLFQCPFIMMTEVGATYFSPAEAERLRDYLLKGGFLWADDFWGTRAWEVWAREIGKALPPSEYPIVDVPLTHPIFHQQFDVKRVIQIPSIGAWRQMGGGTSENGADSATPEARAIFDKQGHMMVFITHNTDFGDAFEQEAADPQVLLHVLGRRLSDGHQRSALRADTLGSGLRAQGSRLLCLEIIESFAYSRSQTPSSSKIYVATKSFPTEERYGLSPEP